MVFKYKVPETINEAELDTLVSQHKAEILEENIGLRFVGSSSTLEAEDIEKGLKTLMLTFDDPD